MVCGHGMMLCGMLWWTVVKFVVMMQKGGRASLQIQLPALPKMSGNKDANWLKFHSLLDIHGHREIRPAFQPERHLGACSRDLN